MLKTSGEPGFGLGLTAPDLVSSLTKTPLNKVLTKTKQNDSAPYLAQIIEKHPELARLIKAWPRLSDETKQAVIKTMR